MVKTLWVFLTLRERDAAKQALRKLYQDRPRPADAYTIEQVTGITIATPEGCLFADVFDVIHVFFDPYARDIAYGDAMRRRYVEWANTNLRTSLHINGLLFIEGELQ